MEQRELYVMLHQLYYRRLEVRAWEETTSVMREMMKK